MDQPGIHPCPFLVQKFLEVHNLRVSISSSQGSAFDEIGEMRSFRKLIDKTKLFLCFLHEAKLVQLKAVG